MSNSSAADPRVRPPRRPRTLILVPKSPPSGQDARIAAGEEPRVEYLELARRLGADVADYGAVPQADSWLVRLVGRTIGRRAALATLGFLRRDQYDIIYATGEDISIPLTLLLRATRAAERVVAVVHHAGPAKKVLALRLAGQRSYHHLICLCAEQQRILTDVVGIPAHKVRCFPIWCDHQFYAGAPHTPGDYLLSVGMESRDYPTLQAALSRLPYPVHVVASGWSREAAFRPAGGIDQRDNITVERGISALRLRDLYRGCRMVVVPLRHTTHAAGVTAIVEAMAMSKPVVVSASPGIEDYVSDGVSGRVVPVGDADALRQAIVELWEHPATAERIGRDNRRRVEASTNLDAYVERVAELLGTERTPWVRPAGVLRQATSEA
jgi:glycosyltransferase involved in cell wall biosynthesis